MAAAASTEKTISGEVTWNNQTFTTPVKLTGDTTLTLEGDNKIECDAPLDLNNCGLTVKGTGTLEVIGNGRSEDSTLNGAIFDSGYKGTTYGTGTLTLEGGTIKASGGDYNAISVRSVELRAASWRPTAARMTVLSAPICIHMAVPSTPPAMFMASK